MREPGAASHIGGGSKPLWCKGDPLHTSVAMRWLASILVAGLLGGGLGLGCGKTVYRSHEGQYCSSTEGDDPYFECSPSYDLICINTYAEQVLQPGNAPPSFTEIFLCRLACEEGQRCPDTKDVCCKGPVYGRDYGKTHACVPAGMCQTVDPPDAGPDTRRDTAAASPDAPVDAPEQQPDAATSAVEAGASAADAAAAPDGAGN